MYTKPYLLTIAIPTFMRANFLHESINRIQSQLPTVKDLVEFIISDNCSTDKTQEVVNKYIESGIPIRFIHNAENIGMDGNFIQCLKMAQGKYVWVLGDDDYLMKNSLSIILDILSNSVDYGIVHINQRKTKKEKFQIVKSKKYIIHRITYWITFISANIVNTAYINQINFEKYKGTFFSLVPLYYQAIFSEKENVIIYDKIFDGSNDCCTNGGYNYFEVFIKNYLQLCKTFLHLNNMSFIDYEIEKYSIFKNHISHYIFKLLFKKEIGNFTFNDAWKYIFSYYWYEVYIYYFLGKCLIKKTLQHFLVKNKVS